MKYTKWSTSLELKGYFLGVFTPLSNDLEYERNDSPYLVYCVPPSRVCLPLAGREDTSRFPKTKCQAILCKSIVQTSIGLKLMVCLSVKLPSHLSVSMVKEIHAAKGCFLCGSCQDNIQSQQSMAQRVWSRCKMSSPGAEMNLLKAMTPVNSRSPWIAVGLVGTALSNKARQLCIPWCPIHHSR